MKTKAVGERYVLSAEQRMATVTDMLTGETIIADKYIREDK